MDVRLDGHAAIITGGSKGLGLAMATRFAQSGADAVMVGRASYGAPWTPGEIALASAGRQTTTVPADGTAMAD